MEGRELAADALTEWRGERLPNGVAGEGVIVRCLHNEYLGSLPMAAYEFQALVHSTPPAPPGSLQIMSLKSAQGGGPAVT